jgi:hypothetical protein
MGDGPGGSGITFVGEHPFALDASGKLKTRIATVFPRDAVLVTMPGVHATQRMAYVDHCNEKRERDGLAPLDPSEEERAWMAAVDLILEPDFFLIRPDPDNMALAFEADDLLQRLVPKYRIGFLGVLNGKVREAIKRRGEWWRIAPIPRAPDQMRRMIEESLIGLGGREIYRYAPGIGTRFLTVERFSSLAALDDESLRAHLLEIRRFSGRSNARGHPEVDFFATDRRFTKADLTGFDFAAMTSAAVREAHRTLADRFLAAVPPEIRRDDVEDARWRNRMMASLLGESEGRISDETLLGLSPEFYMQVEWLPGARVEDGELIFDPVTEIADGAWDDELARLSDDKPKKFIFNFVRKYGDLEFVNVGRVVGSLSHRTASGGRRGVYIVVLKLTGNSREQVTVIRLQKRGVREFLDEGSPLLEAMLRSEEYTEFILDRRLGCRQLGMNLPLHMLTGRISERYLPSGGEPIAIWTRYFERDYIPGTATDKVAPVLYADAAFAEGFARVLGEAAAPNMILGRCNAKGEPLFDDGDEVLVEDGTGFPVDVVVADHTGTFTDCTRPLEEVAAAYAAPVNRRAGQVAAPEVFADEYVFAFRRRFTRIREDYLRRRNAYDSLFRHRKESEVGDFPRRWENVLARLQASEPDELTRTLRGHCLAR